MKIKTENGEYNVTPQGQGSLNTVLGAVGTAGALGMFNGGLGSIFGGQRPLEPGDRPVTRYELSLIRESIAKDAEIAALKANMYTNEQVGSVKQQLNDFAQQQAVYNGVNTAVIQGIQNQVGQLLSMTKTVIPNSNISPGWGPLPMPVSKTTSTTTTQQSGQ